MSLNEFKLTYVVEEDRFLLELISNSNSAHVWLTRRLSHLFSKRIEEQLIDVKYCELNNDGFYKNKRLLSFERDIQLTKSPLKRSLSGIDIQKVRSGEIPVFLAKDICLLKLNYEIQLFRIEIKQINNLSVKFDLGRVGLINLNALFEKQIEMCNW